MSPRGGQTTTPSTLASKSSTCPSGQERQSAAVKCARRCSGDLAPRSISSVLNLVHGEAEILGLARPARRVNAGLAVKRIDNEAGVVGKRRLARGARRGQRLDARIGGKCCSRLVRLGEAKLGGGLRRNAIGRQQFAHLLELAGIVRGDDDGAFKRAAHRLGHRNLLQADQFLDALARQRDSAKNWSSLNGAPLGGRLHLDDVAGAGHDEIGVGLGLRIFGVVEIEHGGVLGRRRS